MKHAQKLTKYSPYITIYKILMQVFYRVGIEVESLIAHLFSTHISDKQFLESFTGFYENTNETIKHIRERKQHKFFVQTFDKIMTVDIIKSHYPRSIESAIADADQICEHIFDLFGSGDVYLGENIDWHVDFKTGWRWKPKYYKKVHFMDLTNPYDVKVPWELNQYRHFVTLGKAYWYTGDEKYVKEFVSQIENWIKSNPPKFGVNWVCTMEVAIRAVNWIWGYYFFKDSSSLTDEFIIKFLKSMLIHGRHIMGNLEKGKINSNHYLSDLAGIVYLGVMFPEFKEAKKWREFGVSELIKEMDNQVYSDGVDYEGSTCYHRLVTELFISATVLCLKNRLMFEDGFGGEKSTSKWFPFPDWYMQRLEKMIEYVMYYTKPDGKAPQIGDNDDGRLHILSNYGDWDRLDHRYILSMGAVLFENPDFKKMAGEFHEEAFWLFGIEGLEKFNSLPESNIELSSKAFLHSGIYIMRDKDLYVIIDCIPNNPKAPTGHVHNSRLSFELYAGDTTFIVDPGTYVYTADYKMRNLFRSTAYHNTVVIDGQEMNHFDSV